MFISNSFLRIFLFPFGIETVEHLTVENHFTDRKTA